MKTGQRKKPQKEMFILSRFVPSPRLTRVKTFHISSEISSRIKSSGAWVVADSGAPNLFALNSKKVFFVKGGEKVKRWTEVQKILLWLAERKAERSEPLVVIGGGAVLDLAALAASLYRRGIPLVLVPTTLLSMVDATLGGKTAVDLEWKGSLIKNFAGTFYPANEVWLFWEFLRSLPPRERISGAGEVFKTMWIRGRAWKRNALITYVQSGRVESGLDPLILDCLRVKSNIVARDPLDEKRIREILNFGHTIGHALESASRGRMSHGESVLWGMLFEAGLLGMEGRKMGILCGSVIRELNLKLPEALGKIPESDWRNLLSADKKNRGKKIELSLLSSPGRIRKKTLPPEHLVKAITQAIASILQK